ncbi:MAG: protein kinase [Clostridiaceae bacterium]|nr:protein kinase [Clostridiaceae bacterium]
MDESLVTGFVKSFDDSYFPENFKNTYEPMECLSNNQMCETLLVKHRKTGKYYVTKCYSNSLNLSGISESVILKDINHRGIPTFIEENKNDEMTCVTREYVEGTPLDKLIYQEPLSERQVISICIQLCDILICIHQHDPPVIHRDIKPQNIIVQVDGNIKLIDFGISRTYSEEAKNDTVYIGTDKFAPPEQYGFSQTDCRSDIFSVGVLLCWLLTGSTDVKESVDSIKNIRLAKIIRKCTAFAPEDRFSSATKLRTALLYSDGFVHRAISRLLFGIVFLLCILSIGYAIGRYTDITPPFIVQSSIKFKEPLIEQAVRLSLGKKDDEPISKDDILQVTKLYICADRIAKNASEYEVICEEIIAKGNIINGEIKSLDDLTMLKNLREISLIRQSISDVSPLKQLENLESIDLKHNPIKDVSALKSLPGLHSLFLFDTYVSDLTELAECFRLTHLDIGKTYINTLADLKGLDNLKSIGMRESLIRSLDGIERHRYLANLYMPKTYFDDLSPLLSLKNLKEVVLDEDLRIKAEKALGQVGFRITYQ